MSYNSSSRLDRTREISTLKQNPLLSIIIDICQTHVLSVSTDSGESYEPRNTNLKRKVLNQIKYLEDYLELTLKSVLCSVMIESSISSPESSVKKASILWFPRSPKKDIQYNGPFLYTYSSSNIIIKNTDPDNLHQIV